MFHVTVSVTETTPPAATDERPREYIEFYRLDLSSNTRRILIPSATLVTIGFFPVCFAGAHMAMPWGLDVPRDLVGFVGGAIVLVGLVTGFGGMGRLLFREAFVGVTRDGIHVRAERRDEFVRWEDLRAIRGEPGALELVLEGDRIVALPHVSAPRGLALRQRLDDLRRKAGLGILR